MRRFFLGLAMIAALGLVPCKAKGNDRQIAQKIVESLQEFKEDGELRGVNIDLQVENGAVYLKGHVANEEQEKIALDVARHMDGVRKVYNELAIVECKKEPVVQRKSESGVRVVAGTEKANGASIASRIAVADATEEPAADEAPVTVLKPDSQELVSRIYDRLKEEKDKGRLKGFALDLEVDQGIASLKGKVASAEQQKRVLDIVRRVPGVTQVINGMMIVEEPKLAAVERKVPGSEAKPSDDLAREVIQRLKFKKDSGELKGFRLDVQVEEGIVWLSGYVADEEQRHLVLETTRYIPGVTKVVNDLSISPQRIVTKQGAQIKSVSGQIRKAPTPPPDDPESGSMDYSAPRALPGHDGAIGSSVARGGSPLRHSGAQLPTFADQPSVPAPSLNAAGNMIGGARQTVQYVWVPGNQAQTPGAPNSQAPLAFAPARSANYQQISGGETGTEPVPLNAAMPGVGIAPARFDHAQMPNYAWPSYAPYPNYGAVTYPKQYSASAWPYIGPFYPYPQVPLGWRKVTLEWDDGWWQLDFKSRH